MASVMKSVVKPLAAAKKLASDIVFDRPISLGAVRTKKIFLLKDAKTENATYFEIPNTVECKVVANTLSVSGTNTTDYNNFLNRIERIKKNQELGVRKKLLLHGLGFRVLNRPEDPTTFDFKLGYSHLKTLTVPEGMKLTHFKLKGASNKINLTVEGTDAQDLGNFVSKLKRLRVPDPYKGKGFIDKNEKQVLKVFKKK